MNPSPAVEPVSVETPVVPATTPIATAQPEATVVVAEPVARAVEQDNASFEILMAAAVIVCLGALWKAYRKMAQKHRRR